MPLRAKDSTEQIKHLTDIRAFLVGLRRAAVLAWGELPETDRRVENLTEITALQAQIDAVDRAMRDEGLTA